MFRQNRKKLFKPEFLRELRSGTRKTVQHRKPHNLTSNGQETCGASPWDLQFFDEFRFFGEIANNIGLENSPWSIHEVPEIEPDWILNCPGSQHGRRYEVWYNHVKAGVLVIAAWGDPFFTPPPPYDGKISATFKLDRFPPRLLKYYDVALIMRHVSWLLEVCPGSVSKNDIRAKVNDHLAPLLWTIDPEDENGWITEYIVMHFFDCFPFRYYKWVNGKDGVSFHTQRMAELSEFLRD